jgi:hypothetical protein
MKFMKRLISIGSTRLLVGAGTVLMTLALVSSGGGRSVQAMPVITPPKEVSLDDSGYVRDYGTIIGQIDSNGYIRDAHGRIIGQFDSVRYVRDAYGRIIGRVENSGYIRNADDSIMGQIDGSGYLRDPNGNLISNHPVEPELAVFLLFFNR